MICNIINISIITWYANNLKLPRYIIKCYKYNV